jgi:UDP-3-O-acyl N-acetylglucosamine deacetylase
MQSQRTIKSEVSLSGLGIFTGSETIITLKPAAPGAGIVFVRGDLPDKPTIPARPSNLIELASCTGLQAGGRRVIVTEHILAGLWCTGITNAAVEMSGEEVPALDGSALPFAEMVERAGIVQQDAPLRQLVVHTPQVVRVDGGVLVLLPADEFRVTYVLEYPQPGIGVQVVSADGGRDAFLREIAPARTFIPYEAAAAAVEAGVIKTHDESSGIVVREGVASVALRFPNEFARHKVVDIVGDFALLGRDLKAYLVAVKSGHKHNATMVRKLAAIYP